MNNSNFSIIWDWNGTIVDDAPVFIKIMNFFLTQRNLPLITLEDYRCSFVFPVKNYYKNLGFDFSKESFDSLSIEFIDKYKKAMLSPPLVKNIKSLLSELNQKKIIQTIVSAQENNLLKQAVNHYNVENYFCCVQGISNYQAVGKINIAKKVFKERLRQSRKTILIGDTEHDAEVARALGIDCCLVSYGHCTKAKLLKTSFPVVGSVEELREVLFNY